MTDTRDEPRLPRKGEEFLEAPDFVEELIEAHEGMPMMMAV